MSDDIVCGFHAILSVLTTRPESIACIWIDPQRGDKRIQQIIDAAREHHIKVQRTPKAKLDAMMEQGMRHQGVVARVQRAPMRHEQDLADFLDHLEAPPLVLVLDGIQDPHNLGACLRSAEAAGVHAVILPKDKAVGLTATVHKAASGAADLLPIFQVTNLSRILKELKERGIWLVGAAGEASQDLYSIDLKGPLAVVMGSEGEGMRRLTRETCDVLARIPMAGHVASLNVSVATGVMLFEAVRQRNALTVKS